MKRLQILQGILITLFILSCRLPSDPIQKNKFTIFSQLETVNTSGDCLDIDINENYLVSAANYNGYFVFEIIKDENGVISKLDTLFHNTDMNSATGDNRAEAISLSKEHNIAFVLDRYDKIWIHKIEGTQFLDPYIEDCYNGVWLSNTIDDQIDEINIFSLVRHNSAEDEVVSAWCGDIVGNLVDGIDNESDCISIYGTWHPEESGSVGEYDEYSTSIVWKKLTDVGFDDLFTDSGTPLCEYSYNLDVQPDNIYFADGLLSVADGELGVKVLKQTDQDICLIPDTEEIIPDTEEIISDFDAESICDNHADAESCCKSDPCIYWDGNDCVVGPEVLGLGGTFEPAGGLEPNVFAEFDTPGEVNTVYSTGMTVFAGLSTSNGCYMVLLDLGGEIISTLPFGQGYTINGIHQDDGLVALAAGHSGVLLYEWDGSTGLTELGMLETSYANEVKVQGNSIYVATEDGIDIFQIER